MTDTLRLSNTWPRIGGIARQYGIKPHQPNDPIPILLAVGDDGQLYEVEKVIKAIRDEQEAIHKESVEWLKKQLAQK